MSLTSVTQVTEHSFAQGLTVNHMVSTDHLGVAQGHKYSKTLLPDKIFHTLRASLSGAGPLLGQAVWTVQAC